MQDYVHDISNNILNYIQHRENLFQLFQETLQYQAIVNHTMAAVYFIRKLKSQMYNQFLVLVERSNKLLDVSRHP